MARQMKSNIRATINTGRPRSQIHGKSIHAEPEPTFQVPTDKADLNRAEYFYIFERGSDVIRGPSIGNLRAMFPTRKMFKAANTKALESRHEHFDRNPDTQYVMVQFHRENFDVVRLVSIPMTEEYYRKTVHDDALLVEVGRIHR